MEFLGGLALAFSSFSALPMPQVPWEEGRLRWVLACFPLVGLVCGALLWGWGELSALLELPELLRGMGFCALPVLFTGGIHLDGYADTADALASCASPERRREILHDPHCGAFAVIRLCLYFLCDFALACSLRPEGRALVCLGLGCCLSRALSALALLSFPLAGEGGFAGTLVRGARGRGLLGFLTGLTVLALVLCGSWSGLGMTAAAAALFFHYRRTAIQKFGGASGDLAGWFLTRAEFWMLAVLVLFQQLSALRMW